MEEQQQPVAGSPIYQETQDKNAKWLWFLIVLIIIGALVFAFVRKIGPFARFSASTSQQESEAPTSSPFEFLSPSPEATAESSLNKAQAKIRVLNGGGKAGAASSVKDFLENKGYKVVAIGNADNFDFEQMVIRFKESFKRFEEVLKSDLLDNYSVKVSGDNLEATDSADIEVIVGAK